MTIPNHAGLIAVGLAAIPLALGPPDGAARGVILAATYLVALCAGIVEGGTIGRVPQRVAGMGETT